LRAFQPDVSLIASQSVQGSPANKKGNKTPFADLSPRSRQAALKESVDRLSRPRNAEGARCNREWKRQEGKEAVRKVLGSPMVGTARGSNLQAPVTPFQPLDASRMTIVNAERSGTVRRGPRTRLRLDGTSLFPEESSAPKHKNLLKRLGDYKPQQNVPSRLSPPQSSSRATAGRNTVPTTSPDVVANGYENSLTDAARQLSLEGRATQ
ncbi:hypothetical protein COOONC_12861, partial [Cooperia oncophora]